MAFQSDPFSMRTGFNQAIGAIGTGLSRPTSHAAPPVQPPQPANAVLHADTSAAQSALANRQPAAASGPIIATSQAGLPAATDALAAKLGSAAATVGSAFMPGKQPMAFKPPVPLLPDKPAIPTAKTNLFTPSKKDHIKAATNVLRRSQVRPANNGYIFKRAFAEAGGVNSPTAPPPEPPVNIIGGPLQPAATQQSVYTQPGISAAPMMGGMTNTGSGGGGQSAATVQQPAAPADGTDDSSISEMNVDTDQGPGVSYDEIGMS